MNWDFRWTADRVEVLERLWAQKQSAADIANHFGDGLTRSAVLGKIHRLRLATGYVPPPRKPRKPKEPKRKRNRKIDAQNSGRVLAVRRPATCSAPVLDNDIPPEQRCSLFDLTNDTCRWPVGEPGTPGFFFCGATTADLARGQPYCLHHTLRALPVPGERSARRAA